MSSSELPPGLRVCEECGDICGTTPYGEKSTCLCEGIPCRICKTGTVRRPVSNHYDPETAQWWHSPYFMYLVPCDECRERGRGR